MPLVRAKKEVNWRTRASALLMDKSSPSATISADTDRLGIYEALRVSSLMQR